MFKRPSRYSAKAHARPTNFYLQAPAAASVFIAGDFNEWNPESHPMVRQPDGTWFVQVALSHGHHRYWFVVDGARMLDPRAQGVGRNERNERVSIVAVS